MTHRKDGSMNNHDLVQWLRITDNPLCVRAAVAIERLQEQLADLTRQEFQIIVLYYCNKPTDLVNKLFNSELEAKEHITGLFDAELLDYKSSARIITISLPTK